MKAIWRPSPNHSPRTEAIKYIVLHGTWMSCAQSALDRLCDPAAEVSCHYLIDEKGALYQLVKDSEAAWHAGISAWKDDVSLNQSSLGIELAHSGDVTVPYTEAQYETLIELLGVLLTAHRIAPTHVLAHSDIAPDRKNDPGPQFDWNKLYSAKVAQPLSLQPRLSYEDLKHLGYVGSKQVVEKAYKLRLGVASL